MKKLALLLAAVVFLSGVSLAATFDKKVVFKGKKLADVTFNHGSHLKQTGIVCKTCHPSIIAKMKAGANKITMADINKGKACGVCHKAKGKAFAVKDNCTKCHAKVQGEAGENS